MLGAPGISRSSAAPCATSFLLSHSLLVRVPVSKTSRAWDGINTAGVAGFEIAL